METTVAPIPETTLDNFPWDDLVELMRAKWLIPVVGSELYQYRGANDVGNYRLYTKVANKLVTPVGPATIADAASPINAPNSIFENDRHYFHKAAEEYLATIKERNYLTLTNRIKEAIREVNFVQAQDILRLAQIDKFRIFINTTYDDFLYHALRIAGRKKEKVLVYNYALQDKPIGKWREPEEDETIIFNVFGNFKNNRPSYTEKDIIESVSNLQSDLRSIDNSFFNKLTRDSYLFIGCSFKNWLLRFIMRSITSSPFEPSSSLQKRFFTSDIRPNDPEDADLQGFLRMNQSKIYSTGTNKFMDAFWNRVQEEHEKTNDWIIDLHCCFVSFHGQDRPQAALINQTLSEAGVKTWFDADADRSGNVVDDVIKSAIGSSTTFLAIVSSHFLERQGFQAQEIWWLDRFNKDERKSNPIKIKTLVVGNVDKGELPDYLKGNFWYAIPDFNFNNPRVIETLSKLANNIKNDCQ